MNLKLRSFFSAGLTWLSSGWPILLIALLQFILHMWVSAHDNFFRDELYYIAASRHLDFGYVDFPPLVALVTAGVRLLLGPSLVALRLLPALSGALVILLTADMVARMGGGRLAQTLAAVAAALGPVFIGSSGLMGMDPLDQLWWTLCAWTARAHYQGPGAAPLAALRPLRRPGPAQQAHGRLLRCRPGARHAAIQPAQAALQPLAPVRRAACLPAHLAIHLLECGSRIPHPRIHPQLQQGRHLPAAQPR